MQRTIRRHLFQRDDLAGAFFLGPPIADNLGKRIFQGACVSCHGWTGISPIIPYATLTGARAINDPTATNVAQVIGLLFVKETKDSNIYAQD